MDQNLEQFDDNTICPTIYPEKKNMKKYILSLLLLSITIVAYAQEERALFEMKADNHLWQKMSFELGNVEVYVPGEMQLHIDTLTTEVGVMDYYTFFYEDKENKLVYTLNYCEYPAGSLPQDSTDLIKDFFDTTVESTAISVQGIMVYQNDITYDEYPGRQWRIHFAEGEGVIKSNAYVVGDRYYNLSVTSHKDQALDKRVNRYLASFSLLKKR